MGCSNDLPTAGINQAVSFQYFYLVQSTAASCCRLVPVDDEGQGRMGLYVRHATDRFLRAGRLTVVARARELLVAERPDQATSVEGTPLPVNPRVLAAAQQLRPKGASTEGAALAAETCAYCACTRSSNRLRHAR